MIRFERWLSHFSDYLSLLHLKITSKTQINPINDVHVPPIKSLSFSDYLCLKISKSSIVSNQLTYIVHKNI